MSYAEDIIDDMLYGDGELADTAFDGEIKKEINNE